MAGLALRHDLLPILSYRVVCVVYRVTLHAVDLVFTALIFDLTKNR